MAHTVKAVAELAGVSVRTLHHYDSIGLLTPASATPAGYRLYTDADLERLQQVLLFRELGLPLESIRQILDGPGFDRRQALRHHYGCLAEQKCRLERLMALVENTLDSIERGATMETKDMFDGFDASQYEDEVKERWGHMEAYKESARRTKQYTKADWEEIKRETGEIEEALAAAMVANLAPNDPEVQVSIARHHAQISERFYDCPIAMYRSLTARYVDDARFAAHYDALRPGLAVFVRDAAEAYCDAQEAERG